MAASVTKALTATPKLTVADKLTVALKASPSTGSPKRRTSYGATAEYGFNRHPDFVDMDV